MVTVIYIVTDLSVKKINTNLNKSGTKGFRYFFLKKCVNL